jgi:hypothetical protein
MGLPSALPHLRGLRGRIVGVLYIAFAALTAVIVVAGLWVNGLDYFHTMPANAAYGFATSTNTDSATRPVTISRVSPQAEGHGLRKSDRIVAVDGRAVPSDHSELDISALTARGGKAIVLSVRSDETQPIRTVRLPRQGSGWTQVRPEVNAPLWFYASFSFVTRQAVPVFLLAASLLLFRRRPRDPEAILFAFAFLLMSYSGDTLWWFQPVAVLPLAQLSFALNSLGWILVLLAIVGFPDGRFPTRGARLAAAYMVIVGPALLAVLTAGVAVPWAVGAGMLAFALLVSLVVVARRYVTTPPGQERQQMKWAVFGFSAMAILYLASLTPFYPELNRLPQPAPFVIARVVDILVILTPAAGLLVSQLRYRLYDADAAISRSVSYGVLTVALVAIFAGSEKIIEALGEQYFGGTLGALAGGVGAALAAVLVVPLHHRLSHWAERRFQRALIELRQGLPLLVGDLRETGGRREIAEATAARVERGVRASRCALVVDGEVLARRHVGPEDAAAWLAAWTPPRGRALDCVRRDPLFPVRLRLEADGHGDTGWLLLGPRPDGSLYGKDEREALIEIAEPVARALTVAGQREASQSQVERRLSRLEAALAALAGKPAPATPAT